MGHRGGIRTVPNEILLELWSVRRRNSSSHRWGPFYLYIRDPYLIVQTTDWNQLLLCSGQLTPIIMCCQIKTIFMIYSHEFYGKIQYHGV